MFDYLRNKRLAFLLTVIAGGVLIQFLLDVIYSLVYRNHSITLDWVAYLLSILITTVVILGLISLSAWLNRKYSWETAPGTRFYIQIFLVVGFVVVLVMFFRFALRMIIAPNDFVRLLDEMIYASFFFIFSLILVFVDLGVNLLNKWRFSLAEIEKFKKENLETQFEMLRMQVNPHFLFNSLNTLSSLIYQNQDMASNFVRELSSVYRYMLEKRKSELVTIEEEMKFTDSFIYLLALRFDKKLIFKVNVPKDVYKMEVVPLTLQILIENAVKHNVVSMKRPLTINIYIEDTDKIVVKNNLQLREDETYSTGIGLSNIRTRLELLSDKKLEVMDTNSDFIVKVPILKRHENKLSKW
jgi:sensor histidine kinase YesM